MITAFVFYKGRTVKVTDFGNRTFAFHYVDGDGYMSMTEIQEVFRLANEQKKQDED